MKRSNLMGRAMLGKPQDEEVGEGEDPSTMIGNDPDAEVEATEPTRPVMKRAGKRGPDLAAHKGKPPTRKTGQAFNRAGIGAPGKR